MARISAHATRTICPSGVVWISDIVSTCRRRRRGLPRAGAPGAGHPPSLDTNALSTEVARGVVEDIGLRQDIQRAATNPQAAARRVGNVEGILNVFKRRDDKGHGDRKSFAEFLRILSLREEGEDDDPTDVVTLTTMHGAKGLEFRAVFVLGLEEGLMPHSRSTSERATDVAGPGGDDAGVGSHSLEEERRLFYVAVTRARDRLYLCAATRCVRARWRSARQRFRSSPEELLTLREIRADRAGGGQDQGRRGGVLAALFGGDTHRSPVRPGSSPGAAGRRRAWRGQRHSLAGARRAVRAASSGPFNPPVARPRASARHAPRRRRQPALRPPVFPRGTLCRRPSSRAADREALRTYDRRMPPLCPAWSLVTLTSVVAVLRRAAAKSSPPRRGGGGGSGADARVPAERRRGSHGGVDRRRGRSTARAHRARKSAWRFGGWTGPVVLLEETSEPLPCAGDWSNEVFEAYQGPIEAPFSCDACQCAVPLGGGCEVPEVTVYQTNSCSTVKAAGSSGPGCTALPSLGGPGLSAAPAMPTAGTCLPSGGELEAEGPSWTALARVCDGPQAGDACEGGACYPAPEGSSRICVYRDGQHACPGAYPNQHAFHHGALDDRTCTACECGPEDGGECTGTLYGYSATIPCDSGSPGTGAIVVLQDGSCSFVPGSPWKETRWDAGPRTPGACDALAASPRAR